MASSSADQKVDQKFSIKLDDATAKKGYVVNFDKLKLTFGSGVLKDQATIEIVKISNLWADLPVGERLISDLFQFDIKEKTVFNNKKPLRLEISYNDYSDDLKKVYFWNGQTKSWQELPSYSDIKNKSVRAIIFLPYARVAILGNTSIKESGYASWYRYKRCNCAASPDYPKGTKIQVTNLANNKSVIIRVNDLGPERDIFPDRVIDLDVVAFKKIAKKKLGVVMVKVEPILDQNQNGEGHQN